MEIIYRSNINSELESLFERIYPPRVCIDNETCKECTLVKVDSANKHGILLEMVQVLTDLDLVISKSYISSDGGWFMDVFHVTDQFGNKLTDQSLIHYIQQALGATKRKGISKELQNAVGRKIRPQYVLADYTAIEMAGPDRPGLLSEISAVLVELECMITAVMAWTHHKRAACILYVEDGLKGGPISDPKRLAQVEEQLEAVVEAHYGEGERKKCVRLPAPSAGRTHTERRLHQLMCAERDYEMCRGCHGACGGGSSGKCSVETQVSIENCRQKGYSIVSLRSEDRPKLLFDTVCVLTDLRYDVFHAAVSSKGSIAHQEYFIRHEDGCILDTEKESDKLRQCLVAAIERRVSHGFRLDLCTRNRRGLLSAITRVFRENGLTISGAELATHGERATGCVYVTDASGNDVDVNTIKTMIRKEIGEDAVMVKDCPGRFHGTPAKGDVEDKPKFSLGSLLWSRFEWLSGNFGLIKS